MTPRREYIPGGPLYVQRPIKFRGIDYGHQDVLPVDQMTKEKHRNLWLSGHASHEKYGIFDRRRRVVVSAPVPAVVPAPKRTARAAR